MLVGKDTWGRKYDDWEIKATLEKEHGLIGVRLPAAPLTQEGKVTVPDRLHQNIQSGYALWLTWQQVTANSANLPAYIEQANAQEKRRIVNVEDRRLRNA